MEENVLSTKEMIEEKIKECVEGLKYVEQGDKKHTLLVNDIKNLTAAYVELAKAEQAKASEDRKFLEDCRMKDLELHYKDTLERDKMLEQKNSSVRDALVKVFEIILKTGGYFVFIALAMRLEFIDNGSITSFTLKELFKAIHPKI